MAHLIEGDRNSKSAEGTGHHLGHILLKILDYKINLNSLFLALYWARNIDSLHA